MKPSPTENVILLQVTKFCYTMTVKYKFMHIWVSSEMYALKSLYQNKIFTWCMLMKNGINWGKSIIRISAARKDEPFSLPRIDGWWLRMSEVQEMTIEAIRKSNEEKSMERNQRIYFSYGVRILWLDITYIEKLIRTGVMHWISRTIGRGQMNERELLEIVNISE